ncbi:unnamed protein product [Zymoseptoria tritici ST99CH_3D7]|uniref:Uncharacterized protein n=1 Tax=Zymoseptoria tritici (strain ST99CH_3D7) TaxID=1276538 RepID=A0A1X7S0J4_ZYMT9|nr:unnamed protein product [Zymoseptoria tritici ST99CH_3D7]
MANASAFNLNEEIFPPIVHDPKLSAKEAADPFAATHKPKYGLGVGGAKNRRRNEARRLAREQGQIRDSEVASEDDEDVEQETVAGEKERSGKRKESRAEKMTGNAEGDEAAAFKAKLVDRPKEKR